jgi:secreted Zn-dependent insulinase-like peptidase
VKLSNGMKIMLISDPSTTTSAASMEVGVGNLLE